jgi:hypothetical protein
MRQRIGFLKKAIARTDGYYSRSGERLVSAKLTQDEVDTFNTYLIPKKSAAAPKQQPAVKAKPAVKTRTVKVKAVEQPAAPVVVNDEIVEQLAEAAAEEVLAEVPALEEKAE